MDADGRKECLWGFWRDVWNERRIDAASLYLTEDVMLPVAGADLQGRSALGAAFPSQWFDPFPDLRVTVEQILRLYGQRWDVETDLRSLKRTVGLQVLRCRSVDMIAKELVLAIVGYNLVRAVMNVAAEQNNLNPRQLSFSRSQDVVNAVLPGLAAATTPEQYQARLRRMLQLVAFCKLPQRSRASTPRQVWGHGCKFARRKVEKRHKS